MDEKLSVILAAGRGSRLREMTDNIPKPMVSVNGVTIISNLVEGLIEAGSKHIVVLTGYMAETLENHLQLFSEKVKITFIRNDIYDKTNNIYTLWLAEKYLDAGFFLFEADIFCEKELLRRLLSDERENVMVVDKFTDRMNGTVVTEEGKTGEVKGVFLKKDQPDGFDYEDAFKTVNFYKIGSGFASEFFIPRLDKYINDKDVNSYYELIIKDAVTEGRKFYTFKTDPLKWWEIDTQEDLNFALNLFKGN